MFMQFSQYSFSDTLQEPSFRHVFLPFLIHQSKHFWSNFYIYLTLHRHFPHLTNNVSNRSFLVTILKFNASVFLFP